MVIKGKKGFCDESSRKELQIKCKRYGLPANKSHSELEKSLLAYLQEGINSSVCNLQKVSHRKCKGRDINHKKAQRKSSNGKILGFPREDMVDFRPHTRHTDKHDVRGPEENTLASPIESSTRVRFAPFEFYVRSEDGISLYVDLNSSPTDWTEKLKNEVHIFENAPNNKSRSLHEDLGCLKEGNKEMRNSSRSIRADEHGDTRCSPSPNSLKEKLDQSKSDPLEKGKMSLIPLASPAYYGSLDGSDTSKEDQLPKACGLSSNSHDHINSVADSCAKAGCNVVCDSDVIDGNHDRKSVYGFSRPSGHVTLEAEPRCCQNTFFQYDSSLTNPAVVDPGCSISSSLEMQSSEVASCDKDASYLNCENGGQIDGFDPKDNKGREKSGLANSSESNVDAPAEEGERSNIVNERCSQFNEASGKTCLNPNRLNSKEGIKRKRKHVESEHQSGNAKPKLKILRRSTRKDFPRRSRRLLSK